MQFETREKLNVPLRDLLYQTVERLGVEFPQKISAAQFFKDARVEFQVQDGKERATGSVGPTFTTCIFENRGKRRVGVAQLGLRFPNVDKGEKKHKMYLEDWDDTVGVAISFVRAVRQYLVDTPFAIRVGEDNTLGVVRTQHAVNVLLKGTVSVPAGHGVTVTTIKGADKTPR